MIALPFGSLGVGNRQRWWALIGFYALAALPGLLWAGVVDAVVFTSEANVRYFARRLAAEGGSLAMLDHVCVACLEPPTAQAAQALGLRVQVVPAEHSPHALALALARCLAE